MKFYKIRHVATGLFYRPSRHGYKENLTKKGKVYHEKRFAVSALRGIKAHGFHTPEQIKEHGWYNPPVTKYEEGMFEIVEYEAVES